MILVDEGDCAYRRTTYNLNLHGDLAYCDPWNQDTIEQLIRMLDDVGIKAGRAYKTVINPANQNSCVLIRELASALHSPNLIS
jgi:hypothetical protein